ncbi:HMG-Y-related protein A [Quillaja saponaria]|uniref:HMG-Y-related protein A n=1 Tax=Quillaja saponaria TaxID=32244 RepID=A0AAD7P7L7_QUISA|nr:HMG-Y-related protein A [Quillaja saponaria]
MNGGISLSASSFSVLKENDKEEPREAETAEDPHYRIMISKLADAVMEKKFGQTKIPVTMMSDFRKQIEQRLRQFIPGNHIPDHPAYAAMIHEAISELNEEDGSTEEAISNYIKIKYKNLPVAHATILSHHLQKLCQVGEIILVSKTCYMLKGKHDYVGRRERGQKLMKGHKQGNRRNGHHKVAERYQSDDRQIEELRVEENCNTYEFQVTGEENGSKEKQTLEILDQNQPQQPGEPIGGGKKNHQIEVSAEQTPAEGPKIEVSNAVNEVQGQCSGEGNLERTGIEEERFDNMDHGQDFKEVNVQKQAEEWQVEATAELKEAQAQQNGANKEWTGARGAYVEVILDCYPLEGRRNIVLEQERVEHQVEVIKESNWKQVEVNGGQKQQEDDQGLRVKSIGCCNKEKKQRKAIEEKIKEQQRKGTERQILSCDPGENLRKELHVGISETQSQETDMNIQAQYQGCKSVLVQGQDCNQANEHLTEAIGGQNQRHCQQIEDLKEKVRSQHDLITSVGNWIARYMQQYQVVEEAYIKETHKIDNIQEELFGMIKSLTGDLPKHDTLKTMMEVGQRKSSEEPLLFAETHCRNGECTVVHGFQEQDLLKTKPCGEQNLRESQRKPMLNSHEVSTGTTPVGAKQQIELPHLKRLLELEMATLDELLQIQKPQAKLYGQQDVPNCQEKSTEASPDILVNIEKLEKEKEKPQELTCSVQRECRKQATGLQVSDQQDHALPVKRRRIQPLPLVQQQKTTITCRKGKALQSRAEKKKQQEHSTLQLDLEATLTTLVQSCRPSLRKQKQQKARGLQDWNQISSESDYREENSVVFQQPENSSQRRPIEDQLTTIAQSCHAKQQREGPGKLYPRESKHGTDLGKAKAAEYQEEEPETLIQDGSVKVELEKFNQSCETLEMRQRKDQHRQHQSSGEKPSKSACSVAKLPESQLPENSVQERDKKASQNQQQALSKRQLRNQRPRPTKSDTSGAKEPNIQGGVSELPNPEGLQGEIAVTTEAQYPPPREKQVYHRHKKLKSQQTTTESSPGVSLTSQQIVAEQIPENPAKVELATVEELSQKQKRSQQKREQLQHLNPQTQCQGSSESESESAVNKSMLDVLSSQLQEKQEERKTLHKFRGRPPKPKPGLDTAIRKSLPLCCPERQEQQIQDMQTPHKCGGRPSKPRPGLDTAIMNKSLPSEYPPRPEGHEEPTRRSSLPSKHKHHDEQQLQPRNQGQGMTSRHKKKAE